MNPMDKKKLQSLLNKLKELENSLPGGEVLSLVEKIIGEKYNDVTSKVKEDSSLQFLDQINSKLNKFKKDFDLKPIIDEIDGMQSGFAQMQESVTSQFSETSKASEMTKSELMNLIGTTKNELSGMTGKQIKDVLSKISSLESQLSFQDEDSKSQGQTLQQIVKDFNSRISKITSDLKVFDSNYADNSLSVDARFGLADKGIEAFREEIKKLREDLMTRISRIGGGSINRQIFIGGVDALTKYSDVNLKAGSNVTLSYQNNETTKKVDITIAATGGSGTVRSISTITVSSVAGAATGTDYVILANGGVQVTLPTAVGNTNLYTIKNVGTSSVLISTTGGQTIDDDANVIMPIRYTSVDLISNNSNWDIT